MSYKRSVHLPLLRKWRNGEVSRRDPLTRRVERVPYCTHITVKAFDSNFREKPVEIAVKTRRENAEAINIISFRLHERQKKTAKTLWSRDKPVNGMYKYMLYSW